MATEKRAYAMTTEAKLRELMEDTKSKKINKVFPKKTTAEFLNLSTSNIGKL